MTAGKPTRKPEILDALAAETPARLIANATKLLGDAGFECVRRDTELMLAHLLTCDVTELWRDSVPVSDTVLGHYKDFLSRRMTHEPVAYIIGQQEFWSLVFNVTPDTLVPRPDTETLVEAGLRSLQGSSPARILDIGTGSGCVLISLLTERDNAEGVGLDISSPALEVAKGNAGRLGVGARSSFIESDLFNALTASHSTRDQFDLIVSNPPYIESADIADLMPDVVDFEPLSALDGGPDGLSFYRRIAVEAVAFLGSDGVLAVEVGHTQAQAVASLFEAAGYIEVHTDLDLSGTERVVRGKKA